MISFSFAIHIAEERTRMLQGPRIALRPVLRSDLPLIEAWGNDPEAQGVFNIFALSPTHGIERGFAESGFLDERQGMLLIVAPGDVVVGSVSYRPVAYGPNSGSRHYSIGINIVAEHRGKGFGAEAQRLLADYLFATFPVMRVEAATDITNLPEQRSLEKAGFTREGVLRKAQWRAGDWHDLVVYSRLRGE